jgi:hypothetical protein
LIQPTDDYRHFDLAPGRYSIQCNGILCPYPNATISIIRTCDDVKMADIAVLRDDAGDCVNAVSNFTIFEIPASGNTMNVYFTTDTVMQSLRLNIFTK